MQKHTANLGKILGRYAFLTAAALLLVALFRELLPANQTTVALTFLVLVLVTASRWRLTYSVYLSVLCTVLYNFFFLPPVGRLTVAEPQNWVTLAVFLFTSVLVSHLAEREHRHAEASEERRQEVERLYEFSQRLLLQEDLRILARSTPSIVASVFALRAVALYVLDQDAVYYSDPDSELLPAIDLKLAGQQSDPAIHEQNGFRLIPVLLGMRSLGVLAVTEGGFAPRMYEAIGTLVAIALERAVAVERTSRLEASRESERLRSALLDSVTHDLRTPLTAIRAAAGVLVSQENLPETERIELAAVVDEESARLDQLIGKAIEMAQLDAETLQIHRQRQSVRELVNLTVEAMESALRGHPLEIDIAEELPAVPMDRELIHRALRHLLENAAKYSPAGSPITVRAVHDGYRLLVTVADRGPGIDAEEQPFIFDKFFRGRQHRSLAKGTGMGLAIAKAILEAHGGGIAIVSQTGEGARFTFWLPLKAEV